MSTYRVWLYGGPPEEADEVFAEDERSAAEEWARQTDQRYADFNIVGGASQKVCVQPDGIHWSEVIKVFHVEGETVPVYYAREVKP